MTSSNVFQIQIPACVDGAELSGFLSCPEFLGLWEEDGGLTIYWQGTEEDMRQGIQQALNQLNVSLPDSLCIAQTVLPQDWNAQWAASVQPTRIGRRIGIRPSWGMMEMPEDGIEIVLDPKQAFGTGHHATTHLLLEWLEETPELSNGRVLDVGTGSGILSMVALRLGALSALGIDCDPVAIDCAKDYAVVNGFSKELDFRICQIVELVSQPYEFILANIDRKTIIELSPEFSRFCSSGTQLLLSGLLAEDESDMVEHLGCQGWVQQGFRARDGWIALQFGVGSSV